MGAEVIEIPTIEIKPPSSYKALDAALKNIAKYDWLILTSVNGVEALFARLKKLRIAPEKLAHLQVAAIGPATQREIEKQGLKVAVTPEQIRGRSCGRSFERQDKREARAAGPGEGSPRCAAH